MRLLVGTLSLVLCGCSLVGVPDAALLRRVQEICDNRVDDNENGQVDCADPECFGNNTCVEIDAAACSDGRDQDLNRLVDCADASCGLTRPCVLGASLSRDPTCPVRDSISIGSIFRGLSPETEIWDLSGTGPARPVSRPSGLSFGAEPGAETQIFSRDRFRFGTNYPAALQFSLVEEAATEVQGRYQLRIGFARAPAAEAELEIDITWDARGDLASPAQANRITAGCRYRRSARTERSFFTPATLPLSFRLQDSSAGEVVFESVTGTSTLELCRSVVAAQASDGLLGLRIAGSRASNRDPVVLLDSVALQVTSEAPECQGFREPILAPGGCQPTSEAMKDLLFRASPRAAVIPGPTGVTVLAPIVDATRTIRVDRLLGLSSRDGRTGFEVDPNLDTSGLGLEIRAATEERLWAGAPGAPTHAYRRMDSNWRDLGPLEGAPPQGAFAVRTLDGTGFRAYYSAVAVTGKNAIFTADSIDGVAWVERPGAILSAASEVSWAGDGLGSSGVAIAQGDGYDVLVYSGTVFGAADGVGIAISDDALHFVPYPKNPVLVGEDLGLDDGGVGPIAADIRDGRLRVWYIGASTRALPACARGGENSDGGRLFVADLVAAAGGAR